MLRPTMPTRCHSSRSTWLSHKHSSTRTSLPHASHVLAVSRLTPSEPCPDGQQAEPDPHSGEIRCTLCPPVSLLSPFTSSPCLLLPLLPLLPLPSPPIAACPTIWPSLMYPPPPPAYLSPPPPPPFPHSLQPQGTARQASYEGGAGSAGSMLEGRCEACSSGQVAMKTLSLKHFTMQPNGALPPNFTTGCHGDCGTFGWRAFQDHLDSGSGHGPTATVRMDGCALCMRHAIVSGPPRLRQWLRLRCEGACIAHYAMHALHTMPCMHCCTVLGARKACPSSISCPATCSGRTMMTHSYSSLLPTAPSIWQQQRVEWEEGGEESGHLGSGEDEYRMSGMWELEVGRHSVMWVWQKLDDTGAATRTTRDSAVIYDIHIEGVAEGGAARCEEVPQGTALTEGGDSYVPCPPGTSSEGGASSCLPCPPNTFNNQPQWACMPCGAGTSSLVGSTECFIGDAARPASFCTFSLPLHSIPPTPYLGHDGGEEQAGHEGERGGVGEGGKEGGEGERGVEGEAGKGGALSPGGSGTVAAVAGNGTAAAVVFDLSPLSRMHPGRMFGPVLDAAAAHDGDGDAAAAHDGDGDGDAAGGEEVAEAGAGGGGGGQGGSGSSKAGGRQAAEYFVSVCDRDSGNDTCYDYSGRSLNTYACKVQCCAHPRTPLTALHVLQSVHIPTNHMLLAMHLALGLTTALYPPALHPPHLPHSLLPAPSLGSTVAVYPLAAVHAGPLTTSHCTPPHPTAPHSTQVDPREARSGAWPGHSLGSAVAVYPLAAVHAGLYRRGLVMAFTGDECPQTNLPRETNLTFICDPAAGHGQPEAWTAEGQMAALNPVLGYPQYAQRGGAVQRIEHSDCSFSLVWYSLFACPLCSHEDYERVETAECMDETRATFKWKSPRVCQLNPSNPLPPDEPCEPCKPGDIICSQGDCADADGSHNVTYSWRQPHHCSPTLPGAASLPAPELVGPCEQQWVYVPSDVLSPMWIALFVGLAVLIVSFGYLSLVTWLRSRRLRQMYQRLVEAEVQMEGDMGDVHVDGDEDAEDIRLTILRSAAFGGPAGRKAGMGVGNALVIQTALSVTLASAARRAGWISYHPERIGNENVRKAVDVALWVGDGITALGCAVIDAVKMAGRGGNRLGRR
ncbi:unnamed protein product [Closterium sp. NIES-54]